MIQYFIEEKVSISFILLLCCYLPIVYWIMINKVSRAGHPHNTWTHIPLQCAISIINIHLEPAVCCWLLDQKI